MPFQQQGKDKKIEIVERNKSGTIEMVTKTAKKARKPSLSAAGKIMALEEGDLRAERIQGTLPHLSDNGARRIRAGNSLSDLPGGNGWGNNIANGN